MGFVGSLLSVVNCNHFSPCFCELSSEEMGPANVSLSLESSFQTSEEVLVKFIVFLVVKCGRLVR